MKKGALCLFLITIKAPQSLLTPKVLKSHQKDEKAVITGGSVSLRLGVMMYKRKTKIYRARMDVRWESRELCSMIASSELECSLVSLIVYDHRQQIRLNYCTG